MKDGINVNMKKSWFITGASRGFGRIWAEAALKRGDNVAATVRQMASVADLTERYGDAVLPENQKSRRAPLRPLSPFPR